MPRIDERIEPIELCAEILKLTQSLLALFELLEQILVGIRGQLGKIADAFYLLAQSMYCSIRSGVVERGQQRIMASQSFVQGSIDLGRA